MHIDTGASTRCPAPRPLGLLPPPASPAPPLSFGVNFCPFPPNSPPGGWGVGSSPCRRFRRCCSRGRLGPEGPGRSGRAAASPAGAAPGSQPWGCRRAGAPPEPALALLPAGSPRCPRWGGEGTFLFLLLLLLLLCPSCPVPRRAPPPLLSRPPLPPPPQRTPPSLPSPSLHPQRTSPPRPRVPLSRAHSPSRPSPALPPQRTPPALLSPSLHPRRTPLRPVPPGAEHTPPPLLSPSLRPARAAQSAPSIPSTFLRLPSPHPSIPLGLRRRVLSAAPPPPSKAAPSPSRRPPHGHGGGALAGPGAAALRPGAGRRAQGGGGGGGAGGGREGGGGGGLPGVRRQGEREALRAVHVRGLQELLQALRAPQPLVQLPRRARLPRGPASPQPVPVLPPPQVPPRGHAAGSRAAGPHGASAEQPRALPARQRGPLRRPQLPERLHLAAAAGRALPHGPLRGPVPAAQQRHGHREHLRAGRPPPLQRHRVGQGHPLLPGLPALRPGGPAAHGVERAVRAQRGAVRPATARGAAAGGRRPPRRPRGRRPRRRLHGPHPRLPGAGGEAQGAARGRRRVRLPQGRGALHAGCRGAVGAGSRGERAGEVAVRAGGVRAEPAPEPAEPLRAPAAAPALAAPRLGARHRAALLRAPRGQDAHRDPHPGHAALGLHLQLALHRHAVSGARTGRGRSQPGDGLKKDPLPPCTPIMSPQILPAAAGP